MAALGMVKGSRARRLGGLLGFGDNQERHGQL